MSVVLKFWPDNHILSFVTFLEAFQNKDINSLNVPSIHFFVVPRVLLPCTVKLCGICSGIVLVTQHTSECYCYVI